MLDRLKTARRIVVYGSGTLALETIETLRHRGYQVIHMLRGHLLWSEVLDPTASDLVLQQERLDGVEIRMDGELVEITGKQGRVSGVRTSKGTQIPCDGLILAIGIEPLTLVFLHSRYLGILSGYCPNLGCLGGPSLVRFKPGPPSFGYDALYALILLIVSGIIGRLIDAWQTHTIARDASANRVGITSALKERLLELEYTIERLSAGKSEPFKQYCLQGPDHPGVLRDATPTLLPEERADFERAQETLTTYGSLAQSLRRQQRASRVMRIWRYIHMTIAPLALVVITYHVGAELLVNVFHIIKLQ